MSAQNQERFDLWKRNVADEFKELSNKEIKDTLAKRTLPYAVLYEQIRGDYNTSIGIRNANAFNAKEVFYIGRKKLDRRFLCGVHNYTELQHISFDQLVKLQDRYTFIGVDNILGSVSINDFAYPVNPIFVFGEEGTGITPEVLGLCKAVIHIPQAGSVRSLNVGTASGIIMHDFVSKHIKGIQ